MLHSYRYRNSLKKHGINIKTSRRAVYGPILFYGIALLLMCIIPHIANLPGKARTVLSFTAAAVFWVLVIAGIITVAGSKKALWPIKKALKAYGIEFKQARPGIISFSSEDRHIGVYIVCVLGLLLTAVDVVFHILPDWATLPCLAIGLLAFVVHCVVDGNNYTALKLLEKILEDEYDGNNK